MAWDGMAARGDVYWPPCRIDQILLLPSSYHLHREVYSLTLSVTVAQCPVQYMLAREKLVSTVKDKWSVSRAETDHILPTVRQNMQPGLANCMHASQYA